MTTLQQLRRHLMLADACLAGYLPPHERPVHRLGTPERYKFVRLAHGVEFMVDREHNLVAIQGSDIDPRDWIRNAVSPARTIKELGDRWPWGFGRGAERIVDWLRQNDHGLDKASLRVTGHSAGGAMAIPVSEILHRSGWFVQECVAFAPACTGKRELEVDTVLYEHATDLVTQLPWWWQQPQALVQLPDMSSSWFDHSMKYYVAALTTLIDELAGNYPAHDGATVS